ncbi:Auxin-responsive protein [Hordeum vulgare]|nr:Auxin-responsive protein [Hordeum vulgare]
MRRSRSSRREQQRVGRNWQRRKTQRPRPWARGRKAAVPHRRRMPLLLLHLRATSATDRRRGEGNHMRLCHLFCSHQGSDDTCVCFSCSFEGCSSMIVRGSQRLRYPNFLPAVLVERQFSRFEFDLTCSLRWRKFSSC